MYLIVDFLIHVVYKETSDHLGTARNEQNNKPRMVPYTIEGL